MNNIVHNVNVNQIIDLPLNEHVDTTNVSIHGPHEDEHGIYYVGAASTMEAYDGSEGAIGDFLAKFYVLPASVVVQSISDLNDEDAESIQQTICDIIQVQQECSHFIYTNDSGAQVWKPETFADAYRYIEQGCPMHIALKETMDVFYTSPREKQRGMLAKSIVPISGKDEFNCVFITAVVAQLAHDCKFSFQGNGREWFQDPQIKLDEPHYTVPQEYLTDEEQEQFREECLAIPKQKNVFMMKEDLAYRGFYPPVDWTGKLANKFIKYGNVIPKD